METDSGALIRHVRMLVQPFFRGASVAMAKDKESYRKGGYQINDIVICCRRGGVKGPAYIVGLEPSSVQLEEITAGENVINPGPVSGLSPYQFKGDIGSSVHQTYGQIALTIFNEELGDDDPHYTGIFLYYINESDVLWGYVDVYAHNLYVETVARVIISTPSTEIWGNVIISASESGDAPGSLQVADDLTVLGNSTVQGNLTVLGDLTVTGNVSIGSQANPSTLTVNDSPMNVP